MNTELCKSILNHKPKRCNKFLAHWTNLLRHKMPSELYISRKTNLIGLRLSVWCVVAQALRMHSIPLLSPKGWTPTLHGETVCAACCARLLAGLWMQLIWQSRGLLPALDGYCELLTGYVTKDTNYHFFGPSNPIQPATILIMADSSSNLWGTEMKQSTASALKHAMPWNSEGVR